MPEENVKKNREVDQKIPVKIQSCYPPASYSIYSYDPKSFPKYRKSSIEAPGAYLFQTHLRGGGEAYLISHRQWYQFTIKK